MSRQHDFAALHRRGDPFLLPNAWDVASAVLLAEAGFPAVGTTSLGVTAAAGLIDGDGTGRAATVALARLITPRLAVPVTVDVEGGYSDDPAEVAGLAAGLADAGVAGINLEDVASGGQLRSVRHQEAILAAVTSAAPALFVNARTDTYWLRAGPEAGRLTETISRLRAYAGSGASGVFVPGLDDLQAVDVITAQVHLPLNLLWRPGLDLARLGDCGVARVSTGSGPYRRALAAAVLTAIAARDGVPPPGQDLPYPDLVAALRRAGDRRDAASAPDAATA
jgi:2-methylisocitrate lyase-like PEP mutase family enzyme